MIWLEDLAEVEMSSLPTISPSAASTVRITRSGGWYEYYDDVYCPTGGSELALVVMLCSIWLQIMVGPMLCI